MLKVLKANTSMIWRTFYVAVLTIALTGCSDDDASSAHPGGEAIVDNSLYIEVASREQAIAIEDPDTPLSFTVKLTKASEDKIAFTVAADEKWVKEYNETQGTEYVLLPQRYRTMPLKLVIPAGSTSMDVDMTITLPDDASHVDYVLPVYLADAQGASIDENGERLLYKFRRGNFVGFRPAIDNEVVTPTKVGDGPAEVTIEVSLSYPVKEEITVVIAPDESAISAYNETYDTNYQMLSASYYTGELSVAIPAGETSSSTTLTVNSLPEEGTYALGLRIKSCSDPEIAVDKEGINAWIYPLRKGAAQAIQNAAIFMRLSGDSDSGPVNSLDLTLEQWSMEYWFRFDDTSDSAANGDTWTTSEASEWRKKVFPPACAPTTMAGLKFCIWPQGGVAMGPVFDFDQGSNNWMSLPSSNGGSLLKPDTWYHLAVTYNGENLCYYLDGKQQSVASISGSESVNKGQSIPNTNLNQPTSWSTLKLALGGNNPSYIPYMKLELAQMRLWNRVITQVEIQENKGLTLDSDDVEGLEGYWKMDEGSGTVLHDSSGKGHDFPTWERLQWSSERYNFDNLNKVIQ